jgi:hypothetical protein
MVFIVFGKETISPISEGGGGRGVGAVVGLQKEVTKINFVAKSMHPHNICRRFTLLLLER